MASRQYISPDKHVATWILIADGKGAKIRKRAPITRHIPIKGNGKHQHHQEQKGLELVEVPLPIDLTAEPISQTEVGRNATGMVLENASSTHHIGEPKVEGREEIKRQFAHKIAAYLHQAKQKKHFSALILVAPPKMLGEIKKNLSTDVIQAVAAELPKDLMKYEGEALWSRLEQAFELPDE